MRTLLILVIAISVAEIHAQRCYICRYGTEDFESSSDPGCGSKVVGSQYLQNDNRWNDLRTIEDQYNFEVLPSLKPVADGKIFQMEENATSLQSLGTQLRNRTHQNIVTASSSTGSLIHYGCAKLQLIIRSPRRNGTLILRSGVWTFQREKLNTCSDTNADILIVTNPSLLTLKPYIREQTACFCDTDGCNSASGLSTFLPLIYFGLFLAASSYRSADKVCFSGQ